MCKHVPRLEGDYCRTRRAAPCRLPLGQCIAPCAHTNIHSLQSTGAHTDIQAHNLQTNELKATYIH